MTPAQIRLYAIARIVAPTESRIRTFAEPAAGGTLYTVELTPRHGTPRWFGVHSSAIAALPDRQLARELRQAMSRPVES